MSKEELYEKVMKTIERGHDVEVRRMADGSIRVFEIKRKSVT